LVRALDADLPVVIETMNALAREVDDMSLHLRRQLQAFPLWTGEAWSSARPIYAVRDEASRPPSPPRGRSGSRVRARRPRELVEALGVTLLGRATSPLSADGYGAAREKGSGSASRSQSDICALSSPAAIKSSRAAPAATAPAETGTSAQADGRRCCHR
jgi:hypothetical protein